MIAEDDSHILPDDSVRAVGPQSFFADPYPALFFDAYSDPAAFKCGAGSS